MYDLRQKLYFALRKSERFFKTDMVYLAKGSFWLNSGQVVTALSSFGLALLFARLVPKDVYGNYRYILSLAGIVATFSLTGLSTGVMQAVARGFSGTFIAAVKVLVKWNSIMFAIALGTAFYYLANSNFILGYGLLVVALFFPAVRTFEIYEAFLGGKKDFKRSAVYRGVVDVGTILFTGLALLFTDNPVLLVGANLLTQFVLDFVFFQKVYSSIPIGERHAVEPGIIEFSKHVSLQNVMANIAAYIDKIIIFHYLGAAEVAIYTFATALPLQIKGLFANIVLLVTPKISKRSAKEAAAIIEHRFLTSQFLLVPLVSLYIIFAPLIFKILFPAYIAAVPYTRWYALVLPLLGNISGLVLTTQKASREQYILNFFGSSTQIILMLTLVHKYGIMGIIWAYLLSKYMSGILSYILAKRLAARS